MMVSVWMMIKILLDPSYTDKLKVSRQDEMIVRCRLGGGGRWIATRRNLLADRAVHSRPVAMFRQR